MKNNVPSHRSLEEIDRSAQKLLRKTRRLLGEAWESIERAKLTLPPKKKKDEKKK